MLNTEQIFKGEDALLSVPQITERLRVSKWLIHKNIHNGELEAIKIGRGYLVPETKLYAWLESKSTTLQEDNDETL